MLAMLSRSASGVVAAPFPIGTAGQPWGNAERAAWLASRKIQRSYIEEVVTKLEPLKERFTVTQYGALSHDTAKYPLYAVRSREWAPEKPCVLVTGGVHVRRAHTHTQHTVLCTPKAYAASSSQTRLRDEWRAGRDPLLADQGGRVRRALQHPRRALREPVGLRDHPAVERAGGRPEPLVQPGGRGRPRALVQPGGGHRGVECADRLAEIARRGAVDVPRRPARDDGHRRER
eukprot:1730720-Prymnesium_polylepis.1